MSDNVNHPAHYERSTSIECIETMEAMFGSQAVYDFCVCNAFKYIWRHKNKNGFEDLEKAKWYLDKAGEKGHWDDYTISVEEAERNERLYDLLEKKMKQWQESDHT